VEPELFSAHVPAAGPGNGEQFLKGMLKVPTVAHSDKLSLESTDNALIYNSNLHSVLS
jgi:hypothetical protein